LGFVPLREKEKKIEKFVFIVQARVDATNLYIHTFFSLLCKRGIA